MLDEVTKKYGKLNILVNNAGVSFAKTIEETSLDEWNWLMNIDSTGVSLGCKYGIEAMRKNEEPLPDSDDPTFIVRPFDLQLEAIAEETGLAKRNVFYRMSATALLDLKTQ
ncbi:MAG TPA: SDR family oxidoreductase [Dehalococcoidia bacterium]|nr:SDR family oxidoreductase [Dehalococcoidia bacterium]